MRSCFVLLFASLLTSCETQGTIETPVFVLKGRDLLLKLHDDPPENFTFVDWKINKTVTLVRFDRSGKANVLHSVTGGFEFPEKNFSVILKNLQEADSGVYSAVAVTSTPTEDKLVAEYKVTVQGPVSPVNLTVDRVDSNSSESCDFNVTCRTHNSHINSTFRCVDRVCSQEGGERSKVTTSGTSLQVYLLKSTIICNHSNQVTWTQDFNTTEQLCSLKPDPPLHYVWVIGICSVALTLILIVVLFIWLYIDRKGLIHLGRRIKDLVDAVLLRSTSAPPQDESPAEHAADLGRRFENLIRSVLQRSRSAAPQMLSPAEHASALGKRFKDLVHEALLKLTPAPHQKLSPEDPDPDSRRRFEDLVHSVFLELTSALPQMRNPVYNPDVGRRFENLIHSVLQDKTSASHQKRSPDYYPDLGIRFEDLVHAVPQEELLNETSISSSFVKPDAGSIQPESGFGREDSL